ncbi:hypothetical protein M513_12082 [Trichuris suis]|uniref:Uncharacterized protein n=1 Tax=Trichuris suis TaxID=68888 RepID=A0A085LPZ3_9BILA|nr:hypothetical protein M513_12082 [Trichuris suis]
MTDTASHMDTGPKRRLHRSQREFQNRTGRHLNSSRRNAAGSLSFHLLELAKKEEALFAQPRLNFTFRYLTCVPLLKKSNHSDDLNYVGTIPGITAKHHVRRVKQASEPEQSALLSTFPSLLPFEFRLLLLPRLSVSVEQIVYTCCIRSAFCYARRKKSNANTLQEV